jgi:hypothetical protein
MMESSMMRWTGHVARMGAKECIEDFGGKCKKKEGTRKTLIYVGG